MLDTSLHNPFVRRGWPRDIPSLFRLDFSMVLCLILLMTHVVCFEEWKDEEKSIIKHVEMWQYSCLLQALLGEQMLAAFSLLDE